MLDNELVTSVGVNGELHVGCLSGDDGPRCYTNLLGTFNAVKACHLIIQLTPHSEKHNMVLPSGAHAALTSPVKLFIQ